MPVISNATGGGTTPTVNQINNALALQLPHWSAALGKVRAGIRNARLLCAGDSTTNGYYANGTTTGMMKTLSYPGQLSAMFGASGFNSHYNSVFTDDAHNALSQPQTQFDTRLAVGSGWSSSYPSLGGEMFFANSATGNLSFTPTVPVDTFIIYYAQNSGFGTFNYNLNGGTNTPVATAGSPAFGSVTITGTLGTNTCNINWVSGASGVYMIGWEAYDSSKKWVSVCNAGWNGSLATGGSNSWTTGSGNPWDPYKAVGNLAPDLTLLSLGINDWDANDSVASYTTAMQTLITNAQLTGDCVLVTPPPSNVSNATTATQQAYITALYSLAATNNIPIVDIWALFVGWAYSNPLGLYGDNLHPDGAGYGKMAQSIFNVIGNV